MPKVHDDAVHLDAANKQWYVDGKKLLEIDTRPTSNSKACPINSFVIGTKEKYRSIRHRDKPKDRGIHCWLKPYLQGDFYTGGHKNQQSDLWNALDHDPAIARWNPRLSLFWHRCHSTRSWATLSASCHVRHLSDATSFSHCGGRRHYPQYGEVALRVIGYYRADKHPR